MSLSQNNRLQNSIFEHNQIYIAMKRFVEALLFVFNPFGVDCSVHNAFDPIVAGNNLMDGVPVLARAQTADNEGHAFVVDGY